MNNTIATFPGAAGAHVLGQPFTIQGVAVPMNMTLVCNCDGGDRVPLVILSSVAVPCPSCLKQYNAFFNPQTGQVQVMIGLPQPAQGPPS